MKNSHIINGHSLVELMIALLLSSLLIAAGGFVYLSQSSHIRTETQRHTDLQECNAVVDKLSRLIRLAETGTIQIQRVSGSSNTSPEVNNDDISISFSVPRGYAVWPNQTAPYLDNWIGVRWNNIANNSNRYQILVGGASSRAALNNAQFVAIAGDDRADENARISNLDLDPVANGGNSGFILRLSARTNQVDTTYINNNVGQQSPLRHIHTCTVSNMISIRN